MAAGQSAGRERKKLMPIVPRQAEAIEMPLYDTADLARIGQTVNLFNFPVGAPDQSIWREPRTKQWIETNMLMHSAIESPNGFNVRDISVLLFDGDGLLPVFDRSGMGNLWAKSYLELLVNMKIYWQGPLSLVADPVCQMGGMQAMQMLRDPEIGHALRLLSYQREHPLDVPIRCQEPFLVRVTPYTPVCRQVAVRVILNGTKLRAVM